MSSTTPTEDWALPELTRARRAIVVVDVVESVRLMQEDEAGFIERWRRFVHEVRTKVLPMHGGRMVKSLGDGMLLEFEGVREAVQASFALHRTLSDRVSAGTADGGRMRLRIGAHAAHVTIDDLDVYGTGVNLAARLATLAAPGGSVVSAEVRDQIVPGLDARIDDMGDCWMRHLDEAVHAFKIEPVDAVALHPNAESQGAPSPPDHALELGVAVLPFSCLRGTPTDALLGEYVADGLIGHLAMTPQFRVPSRLSTRAVADRGLSAPDIGRLLDVRYVVSGHFAVHGQRISIDAELADAVTGRVAATRRVAATLDALFGHPSEPVEELASAVHLELLDAEAQRTRSRPLPNVEGYSLLLGSIGLIHRVSKQDFGRAREALEALVHREPRHGSGYAWLAKWHFLRMVRGLAESPQREREQARQWIAQALERDPYSGIAWSLRGLLHAWVDRDLDAADRAYAEALAHNPSEALAWVYTATLRSWQGRGAEAAEAAERTLALTPFDPMRYYYESLAAAGFLAAARHDDAIRLCERSLGANSAHTPTHRVLAIAQVLSGRGDDARATMQRMRALEPGLTVGEYLARYPGNAHPHAQIYAAALREAGLPA